MVPGGGCRLFLVPEYQAYVLCKVAKDLTHLSFLAEFCCIRVTKGESLGCACGALGRAGVELGENGKIIPRPKGKVR